MNRAIIIGRVGKDPEVRAMQNGDKIANLSVATSERWKDKSTGERKEKTEWHRVVVFGGAAGVVEQYVHKGDQIAIEGQIQTRKWQDQSGQDRYSTEIVVKPFGGNIELLGGAKGERQQGSGESASPAHEEMDDGIPF